MVRAPDRPPAGAPRRLSRRLQFGAGACLLVVAGLPLTNTLAEEATPGLQALTEVPLAALSQADRNPLAARALTIHPLEWKHGETEHFIYHFNHSHVATPISVEAEFHFRVISRELGADLSSAEKSHIYIFENPRDWETFQANAQLEPWTGGIHSRGSLLIVRDPSYRFSDNSLGHEIAHLVLFRFKQRPLPLWLEEGFAEYLSRVTQASYQRARNYNARPRSVSVPLERLLPLSELTGLTVYPASAQIDVFYAESERLVRFLIAADRSGFLALFEAVARGEAFETALSRNFGGRFPDLAALQSEFAIYASKDADVVSASR
ncbi:MAG: hypothetical protein ABI016_04810 [Chthoniobacterales bacterium]